MELRGPRACGSPNPIMAPGTKLLIWKWISIFMQSEYSVVMHFSFYIHHYPLFHLTSLNMSMAFRSPKKTLPSHSVNIIPMLIIILLINLKAKKKHLTS